MGRATITLEDEDGMVACKLTFAEGFDKTSAAHQHAQILIAMMDREMERQGQPKIETLVVEQGQTSSAPRTPVAEASRIVIARG